MVIYLMMAMVIQVGQRAPRLSSKYDDDDDDGERTAPMIMFAKARQLAFAHRSTLLSAFFLHQHQHCQKLASAADTSAASSAEQAAL